jgi:hypothetical protein
MDGLHPRIDRQLQWQNATVLPALAFSILFCFQGANALGMYPGGN